MMEREEYLCGIRRGCELVKVELAVVKGVGGEAHAFFPFNLFVFPIFHTCLLKAAGLLLVWLLILDLCNDQLQPPYFVPQSSIQPIELGDPALHLSFPPSICTRVLAYFLVYLPNLLRDQL